MERRNVVLPITESSFSGTKVLAARALARRALRNSQRPLNVIQEVGRDPLRVPVDTHPEEVINVARSLAEAKTRLEAVLPQATRVDNLTHVEPSEI